MEELFNRKLLREKMIEIVKENPQSYTYYGKEIGIPWTQFRNFLLGGNQRSHIATLGRIEKYLRTKNLL